MYVLFALINRSGRSGRESSVARRSSANGSVSSVSRRSVSGASVRRASRNSARLMRDGRRRRDAAPTPGNYPQ